MNIQTNMFKKFQQKIEIQKRRNKYITDRYNQRSITNRLFK